MSDLEGAKIWLIADSSIAALAHVKHCLEERGAGVELLDLSEVVERIVRDRGESLLETLRDVLRMARSANDQAPETDELEAALSRGVPDLIVAAGSRYLRGLDLVARMVGGSAVKVALLPDYNLGGAWLKGSVTAYVVPHAKLRRPLLDAGVEESRIFVAGPPVAAAYENVAEADALRETFGLDRAAGPVLLVLGEGFGSDLLDKVVFQLSLVDGPYQPVFYAGADAGHAEALRRAARKHGVQARMFGAVPNLHEFIAVADLVVVEASDPHILGALALDRPLVLVGSPGPVTTQSDFLVAEGAAWQSADVLRLGADVELALRADKLEKMSEASRAVARPTGSREVAEALAAIYAARVELVASAPAGDPDDDSTESPNQGPFEIIGAPAPERGRKGAQAGAQAAPAVAAGASMLSAAEAKDELAALIMVERDAERRLAEARRDQEQWRNRLELAREWNEEELAVEAEKVLRGHIENAERLSEELERARAQKAKLKARVRQGGERPPAATTHEPPRREAEDAGPMDKRFRSIEVERDLSDLKERLRREMEE